MCRSQRAVGKQKRAGKGSDEDTVSKGLCADLGRVVVSYVTVDPSVGEDSLTYIYGQGNEVRLFKG